MKYIINKSLILESILSQTNAAFLSGGTQSAEDVHNKASSFVGATSAAKHQASTESAIQKASGGEVVNDLEKAKMDQAVSAHA